MRRALPAAGREADELSDLTFCPMAPPAWISINLNGARDEGR